MWTGCCCGSRRAKMARAPDSTMTELRSSRGVTAGQVATAQGSVVHAQHDASSCRMNTFSTVFPALRTPYLTQKCPREDAMVRVTVGHS